MTAEAYIQSLLVSSAEVALQVSTWTKSTNTYKMIFNGFVIPTLTADSYKIKPADSDTTTLVNNGFLAPTVNFRTINYYRQTPLDGSLPYKAGSYTINCRAYTQTESEALADAVYTALNQVSDASHNCYCIKEVTIPPLDETDNFNSRITANIKT